MLVRQTSSSNFESLGWDSDGDNYNEPFQEDDDEEEEKVDRALNDLDSGSIKKSNCSRINGDNCFSI